MEIGSVSPQSVNVTQYYGGTNLSERELKQEGLNDGDIKTLKKMGAVECATCSSRRYVDGSDDAGVSFQSPTHVSRERSTSAVHSHEREHFVREGAKAQREGREVISNTVQVYTDICPECGRSYSPGGKTTTVTREKQENADHFFSQDYENKVGVHLPKDYDKKV